MEAKKEPTKELANYFSLFRSIGLLIALALVIMAFEWRSPASPRFDLRPEHPEGFDPIIEAPPTIIVPPSPVPRIIPENQKEQAPDLAPIPSFEWEYTETGSNLAPPPELPEADPEMEFIVVEEPASPFGGYAAFYTFLHDHLRGKYPAVARRMGIEGLVFLEFVVEKDGKLSGIRLVKGIGGGCDELAKQALSQSPSWNPGKQRGIPVRQRMTIPIRFKLG